uniref:Uncharacterized protein n=1 Tax=Anopheles atroparvus TaxID=41427 RepID=A0A182IZX0_ANOAO
MHCWPNIDIQPILKYPKFFQGIRRPKNIFNSMLCNHVQPSNSDEIPDGGFGSLDATLRVLALNKRHVPRGVNNGTLLPTFPRLCTGHVFGQPERFRPVACFHVQLHNLLLFAQLAIDFRRQGKCLKTSQVARDQLEWNSLGGRQTASDIEQDVGPTLLRYDLDRAL